MHLFDACLGMGKKLFDKPISDTFTPTIFTPTIFLHINREDVASVSRSSIRQDIEARDTDQAATFKSAKDRTAQPMAIRRHHRDAALVFFGGTKGFRVRLKRLRANFAKKIQIVDSQSPDFHIRLSTGSR